MAAETPDSGAARARTRVRARSRPIESETSDSGTAQARTRVRARSGTIESESGARAEARQATGVALEELAPEWRSAIALLDEDLKTRDRAQRTRDAYAADLAQFAEWVSARARSPAQVGEKLIRRYVAHLSNRGAAPASAARKLAALRAM